MTIQDVISEVAKDYDWTEEDARMLARAIQGEGSGLFGDQCDDVGLAIAYCAINRSRKPWWRRGIAAETRTAFHGTANITIPQEWAYLLALAALLNPRGDFTHGSIFMLSGKDLENEKLVHLQEHARLSFAAWPHSFFFFDFNPWNPPATVVGGSNDGTC